MNASFGAVRSCALAVMAGLFVVAGLASAADAKTFSVFFDPQNSAVSPTGKKILAFVKDAIAPNGHVAIAGHCEASESAPDALSLTRALEIEKVLVTLGVPSGAALTIVGRGAHAPHIPTAAKVAEPKNRRVEITVE